MTTLFLFALGSTLLKAVTLVSAVVMVLAAQQVFVMLCEGKPVTSVWPDDEDDEIPEPEREREKYEDDGLEYADPRDFRDEWLME